MIVAPMLELELVGVELTDVVSILPTPPKHLDLPEPSAVVVRCRRRSLPSDAIESS
jgi:hypothetical protein